MGIHVYVGNLARTTNEEGLRQAFVAGGTVVKNVVILRSPQNDRSRGFGFVEVGTEEEAAATIAKMNGAQLEGQALKVSRSTERPMRSRGDGRSFESYSGLGGRTPGGTRRPSSGSKRKSR